MKKTNRFLVLILGLFILCLPFLAFAQTPNISGNIPGIMVLPFHISGQYNTTTSSVVRFKAPFPCTVLSVMATARASGGTSPTLSIDVKEGGVSILSSAISITAGTVSFGTISDSSIADEAVVTIDLTIGGTSPTWNDITVVLVLYRN